VPKGTPPEGLSYLVVVEWAREASVSAVRVLKLNRVGMSIDEEGRDQELCLIVSVGLADIADFKSEKIK